MNSAKSVWWME